jgi:HpiC1 cyclase/PEP-CTERM motif
MMKRQFFGVGLAMFALAAWAGVVKAGLVNVPNGDFETAPADPNGDGDNDYSTGDISPPWNGDNYLRNGGEAYTRPSSFVVGWQSNGLADTDDGNPTDDGKFGLQQPRSDTGTNQLYYQRTLPAGSFPTGNLVAPFNGDLIGFVNMDDGDGLDQEIQSATLGNLTPGMKYILKVAVGGRSGQNWNDVSYDIMLVANPTDGDGTDNKFGSAGGSVLGTPSSITLAPHSSPPGSNTADLMYMFTATTNDPYAIRIVTHNALMQDGVLDDGTNGGTVPAGTNYRFTQGNFDNVRLECVPEPTAIVLFGLAAFGMLGLHHRRGA